MLNLGDVDPRRTFARELQQFVAGDFVAQLLGNQAAASALTARAPAREGKDLQCGQKLPELVRAHAAGDVVLILTGVVLHLPC